MSNPEARVMRFPDGAVRPAYNAQIAAAPKEGVIVSICRDRPAQRRGADGRRHRSPLRPDLRQAPGRHELRPRRGHRRARPSRRGSGQHLNAAAGRTGRHQAGQPRGGAASERSLSQGVAGTHGERGGPSCLCSAQAHRADPCRPQEPQLRLSCRARSLQGQGLTRSGTRSPTTSWLPDS
jgi:hypothetical protein